MMIQSIGMVKMNMVVGEGWDGRIQG